MLGKLRFLLLIVSLLLSPSAFAQPTTVFDTSFEGNAGKAPAGWSTWGKTATWSWDSSIGHAGSRSLSIHNSRWNVGWQGPSFPVDSSYASNYPCYVLAGSDTLTIVPFPGALSILMEPLCASTILLQIARPSPVPPLPRVRESSMR